MGILDDILATIPADAPADHGGNNEPNPAANTPPAEPKEPVSGWYGKQFRETYMQDGKPS
jgi:hypothetical protein